jgi:diguanylate cyclase (GGDEF)-like protein
MGATSAAVTEARDRDAMSAGRLPGRGARLAVLGVLALTYVVTARLGLRLAYLNPSATTVWPPTGIALSALLIGGSALWPAILLGAFLANLATTGVVVSSVGIAVGNTAEAVVGAYLVNRFANGRHAINRAQDIVKFALLAGGISTTISATLGVISLLAGRLLATGTYNAVWVTWWLGDLCGAVIVAPVVLLWSAEPHLRWNRRQVSEAAVVLLMLVAGGLAVFGGLVRPNPLIFLALPLLLWPAFRFGPRETASAALLLAAIAVAGTLRGYGPFVLESPNESLLQLQSFMGVNAVTAVAVAAVVKERKRLESSLAHLADHDSLTDVLTRRRFQEELAQQVAHSQRYGTPGAVLFVDLDNFKSVNDRLGHGAGDQILIRVAKLLRRRLRDSDFLGRLGGDEFAILLPRADGAQAEAVAAQVLQAIASDHTPVDGKAVDIGASIGIALIPEHGGSVEELLAHADAAMFEAKAAGRNLSRVYAPQRT